MEPRAGSAKGPCKKGYKLVIDLIKKLKLPRILVHVLRAVALAVRGFIKIKRQQFLD